MISRLNRFSILVFSILFLANISLAEAAEKIPFKPRWVSILKKGKFFKYKRKEFSSPVLFEDALYVGSDSGYFYRFDKDGDKVWRIKVGVPLNSTPLAARFGDSIRVFFGDDEGNFHAVDGRDGKEIWKVDLGSEIESAPAFNGSRLFVSTQEGKVISLSPEDGHTLWEKEHPFMPGGQFGEITIRGTSDPVVDESRVYVGFADGAFWALSQSDGKTIWEKSLATGKGFSDVDAPILIDQDKFYVAGFEGSLAAYSRKDGKSLWTKEVGSAVKMLLVTENDEKTLYVSGSDSTLYAINAKTGDQLWKLLVGKGALTSPVYYKGTLAVGLSTGTMNFIDAKEGKLIIHRFAKKGIYSNPVLEDDKIYYLSNGGRLYSLRFKSASH